MLGESAFLPGQGSLHAPLADSAGAGTRVLVANPIKTPRPGQPVSARRVFFRFFLSHTDSQSVADAGFSGREFLRNQSQDRLAANCGCFRRRNDQTRSSNRLQSHQVVFFFIFWIKPVCVRPQRQPPGNALQRDSGRHVCRNRTSGFPSGKPLRSQLRKRVGGFIIREIRKRMKREQQHFCTAPQF